MRLRSSNPWLIITVLVGCASPGAPTTPGADPTTPPPAGAPITPNPIPASATWEPCANEYSGCSFTGLREVRYVLNGAETIARHFGGLESCTAQNFGLSSGGAGAARCQYRSVILTQTLDNPMPGMAGLGARVTVPLGHAGYAESRIKATEDRGRPNDIGAFRIPCAPSHFNFDDPIVHPGRKGAAHLHLFFGNTETDAFSTAQSLATSGRSTCAGGLANRSAYWVPALVDGDGVALVPTGQIFYYKTGYGGVAPAAVRAPPAGLRMIAGSANATSIQPNARWSCHETYIGAFATIREVVTHPQCGPGNSLNLGIDFPQCWDGVNLDSPDHKSHMAFPTGRGCPSTHPVPIPVISFNVQWKIPPTGASLWHLTSDMYDYAALGGGMSLHGDWFNAWDPAVEAAWIRSCNQASRDCHAYLLGDGRTLF